MSNARVARATGELARDLDLVVFQLEREPPEGRAQLVEERARIRRELERLRDRLHDLSESLDL